jgi:hypothetical protein
VRLALYRHDKRLCFLAIVLSMEAVKKGGKFAAEARKCVARQAKETGRVGSHRVLGLRAQREPGPGSAHLVGSSASAGPCTSGDPRCG